MPLDIEERHLLAKLLNMLRSPVAGEREAAVAKLNAIAATWSHDWTPVLIANVYQPYVTPPRPKPVYRSLTLEERFLINEMLASVRNTHQARWLSPSNTKMLRTRQKRGNITAAQERKFYGTGGIKWQFEFQKRCEAWAQRATP
jgi:hypothetical protein